MLCVKQIELYTIINMHIWYMYSVCISTMFFLVKIASKKLTGLKGPFRSFMQLKKTTTKSL